MIVTAVRALACASLLRVASGYLVGYGGRIGAYGVFGSGLGVYGGGYYPTSYGAYEYPYAYQQPIQTFVPVAVPVPVPVPVPAAPVATAVPRPVGVTGRRHLHRMVLSPRLPEPEKAQPAPPPVRSPQSAICPVNVSQGAPLLRTLRDLVTPCATDVRSNASAFCLSCVAPVQAALIASTLDALNTNRITPEAVSSQQVQLACGQLAAEQLEACGLAIDDNFIRKTAECSAFAARRECLITDLDSELAQVLQRCNTSIAAAQERSVIGGGPTGNAMDGADLMAGQLRYCTDCYWGILGLIMRKGNLSDTFWCAARTAVAAAEGAPPSTSASSTTSVELSGAQKSALAALFDPRVAPRFSSCVQNVQGAARQTGLGDPLGSPAARLAAPRCWSAEVIRRAGPTAVLDQAGTELMQRLQGLSCPSQPPGFKPFVRAARNATARG